jgi:acetolactate synthase small subunit
MQAFHVHYRNTQGTLMRILTAVSRRAVELTYVHAQAEADADEQTWKVTLLLEVNAKQVGQLRRDWYAVVDVTDVRSGSAEAITDHAPAWPGATPHPPSPASHPTDETIRVARA